MRLRWVRDARGREEEIIALVALTALALGAGWLRADLPTPRCVFHALTGIPCVTCGATRAFRCLLNGDFPGAFAWNPLVSIGVMAIGVGITYAGAVALLRLPRVRVQEISGQELRRMRVLVVTAVAANWVYLGLRFSGAL